MTHEIELKLELAEGAHGEVGSLLLLAGRTPTIRRQLSIYYDTPSQKLATAGCSLRVRHVGGAWVQTFKQASASEGLFSRDEWEWDVESEKPDVGKLLELPAEIAGSPAILGRKLRPTMRSEVERTSWVLEGRGSRIQVDLDLGSLSAGKQETRVEEVEFELLEGPPDALVDIARELATSLPARLGVLSKAERGSALEKGKLGQPQKAEAVDVNPSMSVLQAFSAIVHACLKHYRLNENVVLADRREEALHQARVALRRLRAAFTLFKPAIAGDARYEVLRSELRWFTNQLGDARDLDVFLKRDLPDEEREAATMRREQAYDLVIAAMNEARSRVLLIDLTGWVATGEWRDNPKAARPICSFAGKRLDKLWGTVDPTGRSLAQMDEESRHQLRIQVKKMRYAAGFFNNLYGTSKRKKRFTAAIEDLQEALGLLNDLATARGMNAADGHDWLEEQSRESEHLREAEGAHRRLSKAGPFWRGEDKKVPARARSR